MAASATEVSGVNTSNGNSGIPVGLCIRCTHTCTVLCVYCNTPLKAVLAGIYTMSCKLILAVNI